MLSSYICDVTAQDIVISACLHLGRVAPAIRKFLLKLKR